MEKGNQLALKSAANNCSANAYSTHQLQQLSIQTLESTLNALLSKNERQQDDMEMDIYRIRSMLMAESPVDRFREYQLYDSVRTTHLRDEATPQSSAKSPNPGNPGAIFKEPLGEIATISYSNDLDESGNCEQMRKNKKASRRKKLEKLF